MNMTALFVELLVIGIGAASWLALLFAGILDWRLDVRALHEPTTFIAGVTALAYVLGIIVDRLARGLFMRTIEPRAKRKALAPARIRELQVLLPRLTEQNSSVELEKFIRAKSETLSSRIDYNRSRLRICRAWVLNFFCIGLCFAFWSTRVGVVGRGRQVEVLLIDAVCLILALGTTYLLAVDCEKDLLESFDVIVICKDAPTLARSAGKS